MYGDHQLIPQGWQCPVCKRVYSPTTSVCSFCGGGWSASTTTVTNDPEQLAEKYKKMLDDVIKHEDGEPYELYLMQMNPNYWLDMMRREESGNAQGDSGGSDAACGAGTEG